MLLAVVVVLAALLAGWAGGGHLAALGALELRTTRLVVAAVLAQLAGGIIGGPFYPVGLAVSAGLVGAFLVRNRGTRGTGLVAAGLVANALVVGLNGAMPVSGDAAGRAGVSTQAIVSGEDPRHTLADRATRLRALGDVVPVVFPVHPEVVSPGDVLVVAGLGQLITAAMWAGRRRR